ncbi:MAG TPA: hypothetical protein VEW48_22315 [Thermoanaerobaculia bacterium]|nr:hypothetical protein [Thermoanaerobaculia bacterium]
MFQTGPSEQEKRIVARIRPLRIVCGVLAGMVGACAVTAWMLVEGLGLRSYQAVPEAVPLGLTVFVMVMILLSSRLRTTVLRRAFPRSPGAEIDLEAVLSAYRQATLLSFAVLTTAAVLAVLVALFTGIAFYGIFLCIAAAFAMLTRWPNLRDADRLARGRRSP